MAFDGHEASFGREASDGHEAWLVERSSTDGREASAAGHEAWFGREASDGREAWLVERSSIVLPAQVFRDCHAMKENLRKMHTCSIRIE